MRKLTIDDRDWFDKMNRYRGWESFYHYFPLIYAMSDGEAPFMVENGRIWFEDQLVYPANNVGVVKKVLFSMLKAPISMNSELFDVNYVYDIETTLAIKNLRKNVRRFARENSRPRFALCHIEKEDEEQSSVMAWQVIRKWYEKGERAEYYDFDYTRWLTHNFRVFKDLRPILMFVEDKPIAFSLWGTLRPSLGIHLICKDTGIPYAQDYIRYITYQQMQEEGIKLVNDGSDCEEHGIRMYKLKLRPKFIIPIYSWVRP